VGRVLNVALHFSWYFSFQKIVVIRHLSNFNITTENTRVYLFACNQVNGSSHWGLSTFTSRLQVINNELCPHEVRPTRTIHNSCKISHEML
jgi:hypothetical protein